MEQRHASVSRDRVLHGKGGSGTYQRRSRLTSVTAGRKT